MFHVTADESFLLKDLSLFHDPVEIHDGQGKILGIFVPGNLERCQEIKARAESNIDRAEMLRRIQCGEKGTVTLRQIIDRIHELDEEMKRRRAAGEPEWTREEALAYFRSRSQEPASTNGPAKLVETKPCPIP
jgi:hypothetical protein